MTFYFLQYLTVFLSDILADQWLQSLPSAGEIMQ